MKKGRLEQLENLLKNKPGDPFLMFAIARETEVAGEPEKARSLFENIIEEHPDYVGAYYHLGKLYESLQQDDKAEQTYLAGIEKAGTQNDIKNEGELKEALALLRLNNE